MLVVVVAVVAVAVLVVALQARRQRRAGGAVLRVWSKSHTRDGVRDADLEEAEDFVTPFQKCLEDIDEVFGEDAAVDSEKMLMRVRQERLEAQQRDDEIFVAATIIQNLYVLALCVCGYVV